MDNFGCEYSDEICVDVLPELVHDLPNDLSICDPVSSDAIFNLTTNEAVVLAPNANPENFVVTFHNTEVDAENDTNLIANPSSYVGVDGEVVFLRFEYLDSNCFEIETFQLILLDAPEIFPTNDLILCDDITNDGIEAFDLEQQTIDILGTQVSSEFIVTYYVNSNDADLGENNLVSPYNNISNSQPIYIRVQSIVGEGCYVATKNPVFNLIVTSQASATAPNNLTSCDTTGNLEGIFDLEQQTALVLGAQDSSTFTVTYHSSQNQADTGDLPLVSPYTTTGQTIYVRVKEAGAANCYGTTEFELIVNPLPSTVVMTPLTICADDTNGFASFTLTDKDTEALNGQTDIIVSYHANQTDADVGSNALASPFVNTTQDAQTIYIRLENTNTLCFSTMPLELGVGPLPVPITPTLQTVCDDDFDGFASFDFSGLDLVVLGGQTAMVVSYHASQSDADTDSNALSSPYTSTEIDTQTIFIRLETTATGCYATTTFGLEVYALPVVPTITDYVLCDNTGSGDLQELFDLSTKDIEIINGQNVSISYYETQTDANNDENILTDTYQNTSNPETLYLALTDLTTGCRATGSFILIVNPLPSTLVMTSLDVCDDDADGFGLFTLTDKDTEALNGQTDIIVSYHANQTDADVGSNALASPFVNTTQDAQTIYIRLENTNTLCFSTMPLELGVGPLPVPITPTLQTVCDDDFDGFASFDFSGLDLVVLGGQTAMVVSYHASQSDADTDSNALSSPYTSTEVDTQTIFIRLETTATGCYATTTFGLEVYALPVVPTITDYVLCDNTGSGDLQELFDLSTKDIEIINGQNVSISYYETQTDANNDENILTDTYQNTSNPETLYLALTDLTTGCRATGSFILIVNPLPSTLVMTSLDVCDDDADGFGLFTLTDKDTEALGGQSDILVSYHVSEADANINSNALSSPYLNTTQDTQTIYIRLESSLTAGCYSTMPLDLVVNPLPVPITPTLQTVCDDDFDGFASFDFSGLDLVVLGGQTAMVVSYHASQSDADTDSNALSSPYTSTEVDTQTIFIRLETTATGCYATTTLGLEVYALPVVPTITDYVLCDDDFDGFTLFDLSTKDIEIINGQNASISYYANQADADAGNNVLVSPYQNTSSPQPLFVSLTDLTTGCRSTGSFTLIVNPLPSTLVMTSLDVCDDDADGFGLFTLTDKDTEALGGQSDILVSYHVSEADANINSNALSSPYLNTTQDTQTIYIRLENMITLCYSIMPLDLVVNPLPVPITPTLQTVCDDDFDGFASFDFSGLDLVVLGGQTAMVVSYHASQSDADTDSNALSSPYTSTEVDTQTIFIRLETTATGCYATTTLGLEVYALPVVPTITDYVLCDDDFDGFTLFDLSTKDIEIINGQNASISYYANQADADAGNNVLVSPYQNTSSPQPLFVSLTDLTTGCRSSGSFTLIVNPLPFLVSPSPLEVCDDGTPDGLTVLDLSLKDEEIRGGNSNYSISYYLSQSAADTGIDPLPIPYTNISNPQTIFVRGQDITTGCITTTTLDLGVIQAAVANTPPPMEYCDPDNDGYGAFILTDSDFLITGVATGVTVTYHETLSDAENGVNALSSPYNNVVIDTQTIYARVESATVVTDCATIIDLVLNVSPTPQLITPTALELCDDNLDQVVQFDLSDRVVELLDGIALSDVVISFYETEANASSSSNAISTPLAYSNISNPQTVWVRVEYPVTGCEKLTSLELIVNPLPVIVQPTPLALCDDAVADSFTSFDLTLKNTEITVGDGSLEVVYYTTFVDAESATNAIADPTAYTNQAIGTAAPNPQTLHVRVTDLDTGCYDLTTLTIRVLPNPTPSPDPMDLELCDDTNSGDGFEVFDLTTEEIFILNGELGVSATYHETLEDAQAGEDAITAPETYTNIETPAQTIHVRVTNDLTGCYTLVDFDIIVLPLPNATAVADMIACELNTDDVFDFDLNTQSSLILAGQDPSIFEVTYHTSLADAQDGMNFLGSPYTNSSDPEIIYVSVFNTDTECRNTQLQFTLEVHEAAQASAPLEVYVLCDDNVETDGDPTNDRVQFDLSTQDLLVLNGQDPLNYTVSYYPSQADADQGINALPTLYENGINPQVIIARVDNDLQVLDATGSLVDSSICYETALVTLEVNPLPIVDIDPDYILCVDTNGTEVLAPLEVDTGLSSVDYTFIWSDATGAVVGTGSSYAPLQGGNYTLEVFDATLSTQCAAPVEVFTVIESTPPLLTAQVSTAAFASTHVIEAVATGQGIYEYSLDQGPWGDSGMFIDVTPGQHVVTARDLNGCGEAQVVVYVIDYPLYFTPNGDGYNDTWNIVGIANQANAKILIFDRYGKLLKQISPSGTGWDGTYNGAQLPSSDYWFTLEYLDPTTGTPEILRAHFSLKR